MKITEIIVESRGILKEGARIMHAEDLVFFEGSQGALRAVTNLLALFKDKSTLSIKWDGSPAIVAGRGQDGKFVLTDKAGFGAKGYDGMYKSADAFVAQKRTKGTSEDYLAKIVKLWPIVEAAFPKDFRGFILGDVMWFPGELKDNGVRYVFTPNTVTYEVDKRSELGLRVGQGKAGVAVHTFFEAPGAEGIPLKDTAGLNTNGPLCVMGPEIKNEATLQKDKQKASQITKIIKSNAKAIDSFLDRSVLAELKMTGLPDMLYTYVNAQTKTRDLSMLTERFLPWVQSNPKLSKIMIQKVSDYSREHADGLKAVFAVFDTITELKLDIIRQLDGHEGQVIAHVAGERGGEGYVSSDKGGPIKMVNRVGFSAANFAGNA